MATPNLCRLRSLPPTTPPPRLFCTPDRVGRRKFILPLYKALLTRPDGPARARRLYAAARPNYHAVATSTLDALLGRPTE
jgi:hypothetical protein